MCTYVTYVYFCCAAALTHSGDTYTAWPAGALPFKAAVEPSS